MNIAGQNIVVFDCEIKNVIDNKEITWNDHAKMGISVACAFDFRKMDYLVYMDDNIHELVDRLNDAALVVGFNINGFDIPLLKACVGKALNFRVYDLLDESRASIGWRPGMRFPTGMKLDDHLRATFGESEVKTAHGSEAPIMWQEKQTGKLVSYCLADVKRESKLFMNAWQERPISTQQHGARILRDPKKLFIQT